MGTFDGICASITDFKKHVMALRDTKSFVYDASFPSAHFDNSFDFAKDLQANAEKFTAHVKFLERPDEKWNDEAINKKTLTELAEKIKAQAQIYQSTMGKDAVSDKLLSSLNNLSHTLESYNRPGNNQGPHRPGNN